MSPDQSFARWVRVALVVFCVLFVYFVVADTYMPMTPQARVLRPVVRVAPEVSGRVGAVAVTNNQRVKRGDVLFSLDREPFDLALREARLAREGVERDNALIEADLAGARADLEAARASAEELAGERRRAESLLARQGISRQRVDSIVAQERQARASVDAALARVRQLEVKLGDRGDGNLQLRQANNAIEQAQLDLAHTLVRAERDGVVTNLQLREGDYASRGQPALALVGERLDLVADLREKSLRHVREGESARVVFDALPGRVFEARVASRDAGVRAGQLAADGQLADIPTTDRWVRDAQRVRLHLEVQDPPASLPVSGARATVQLLPEANPLGALFGGLQIRLMSWLHYVY
ncbi:HlyD family secretion protein [Halomonas organivorans]|uniref:Multidrug resistance efflux pump n=1 Tax=Halomonas organivorans TaxID=257772 RepID=A0A7W5BXN2_9GAMM|nr:HlyD family secretion protein [Halomonas organivorans]MBB3140709.1 multidrug resistance efflux pump [Halomonas organivorans]